MPPVTPPVRIILLPAQIGFGETMGATELGGAFTVTTVVVVQPVEPNVNVIVAVPLPVPVIISVVEDPPAAVATEVLALDQVPVPVASDKLNVPSAPVVQKGVVLPLIATGAARKVIVALPAIFTLGWVAFTVYVVVTAGVTVNVNADPVPAIEVTNVALLYKL